MKINVIRAILLLLFRLILFLVFLEIFLQLGGITFTWKQAYENKEKHAGNTYKIMCLGDSNTAVGGEDSYPSQLQGILNNSQSKIKFEVINKGIPAASSSIILDQAKKFINEVRPHMVLVMMGGNDRRDPVPLTFQAKIHNRLHKLRTYRLFLALAKRCVQSIKGISPKSIEPKIDFGKYKAQNKNYFDTPKLYSEEQLYVQADLIKLLRLAEKLRDSGEWEPAEKLFSHLLGQPVSNSFFTIYVADNLMQCLEKQKKYSTLPSVWHTLFDLFPYHVPSIDMIQRLCKEGKASKEIKNFLEDELKEDPHKTQLNGLLGTCYIDWGNPALGQKYITNYQKLKSDGDVLALKLNYLKLVSILKKRHIKGVFIEYPLRPIKSLASTLSDVIPDKDFLLIENLTPFREAQDPSRYHEFFSNRCYIDVGHATPKGNYALAKNIAQSILKHFFSID